jgi:hypothetical protein
MATTVNVNQNNNTVTLDDQNRSITVTDNKTSTVVNISQPITRVVTVSTIGPQGPQGLPGADGASGDRTGPVDWSDLTNIPNLLDYEGDIQANQLAVFADTNLSGLPVNLPFNLPLEVTGDLTPTVRGLSGLTYDGSVFYVQGNISSSGTVYASQLILDYDALPTVDPVNKGQVWRDTGGVLKISRG